MATQLRQQETATRPYENMLATFQPRDRLNENLGTGGGAEGLPGFAPLENPNLTTMQIDENEVSPSTMVTTSTLMPRKGQRHCRPTCWFEPLGYCSDKFNINGWCAWHIRHFFNIQTTSQDEFVNEGGHLQLVRFNRELASLPLPLTTSLVGCFPIIELYQDLTSLEQNLNFGLFAYTVLTHKLSFSRTTNSGNLIQNDPVYTQKITEEVNRIVAEHKAYLLLMLESVVRPEYKRAPCTNDPIILLNTNDCVNYVSTFLEKRQFMLNLLVPNLSTGQLQHLDLRKCSTFTISFVTLFELSYAFSRELNLCLSMPTAFNVANGRDLLCDQSKLSHGTLAIRGQQTYGSPCTLGMFRSDTGGDLLFIAHDYRTSKERCLSTELDRKKLLERTVQQREEEQRQQQQQQSAQQQI